MTLILALILALALTQWLGWAGSTGDRSVHYVAADTTLVPPRQRDGFTETLLLLPRCYQLNDHAQVRVRVRVEG